MRQADKNLRYLRGKFPQCPAWQVSITGGKDFQTPEGIRVAPALTWLRELV